MCGGLTAVTQKCLPPYRQPFALLCMRVYCCTGWLALEIKSFECPSYTSAVQLHFRVENEKKCGGAHSNLKEEQSISDTL